MNWTDWLMLVVYGLTCLNVGYLISLSNTVDARRKEIDAIGVEAVRMLDDASEKLKTATGKIDALNEAVALWNYGAREEAIATLKAAGVLIPEH